MDELVLSARCLCGQLEMAGSPLIETAILQAIACLEEQEGKARTLAIAIRVTLSEQQTRRYLVEMEQRGLVKRIGSRGGWQRVA